MIQASHDGFLSRRRAGTRARGGQQHTCLKSASRDHPQGVSYFFGDRICVRCAVNGPKASSIRNERPHSAIAGC